MQTGECGYKSLLESRHELFFGPFIFELPQITPRLCMAVMVLDAPRGHAKMVGLHIYGHMFRVQKHG